MSSNQIETGETAPSDPRVMVLYRFDDIERVVLLDSETTALGSVTLEIVNRCGVSCLRIRYELDPDRGSGFEGRPVKAGLARGDQLADQARIVIALPIVAIDGDPEQLLLEVLGDASGCEIATASLDAAMRGLRYSFGAVDFTGWRTCRADIKRPLAGLRALGSNAPASFRPPLQLFRMYIAPPEGCTSFDLSFGSMSISGDVRMVPSGLAGGSY